MIPPTLLRLHIAQTGNRGFRLWFPLILLWPLFLLFLPLVLLAGLFTFHPLRFTAEIYQLLCALRGLMVDVRQPDNIVKIHIW